MEPLQRVICDWCGGNNLPDALTCVACGAPLDLRNLVSDSGWREAPRLRDMTEFRFGNSTCQVEGEIVPVAEIALGPGRRRSSSSTMSCSGRTSACRWRRCRCKAA